MTTLRTPATTDTADPAPRHGHLPARGPSNPGA
jgi:hypothetical protein